MFLLLLISILSPIELTTLKIDFGIDKIEKHWIVINDSVMGGLSTSSIDQDSTSYTFSGTVSLKNNGGFASIRSPYGNYDLQHFKTMRIRYKSQNRGFAVVLEDRKRFYQPYHKQVCNPTNPDEWVTAEFALSDFKEYVMGKETGDKINQSTLNNIIRFGIVVNDKKEGPFEIELDYIEFI